MQVRNYKPYTPSTRTKVLSSFAEITKKKPEKSLIQKNYRKNGRNNRGIITTRHKGGGHKKKYRKIDFKRDKLYTIATVKSVEYDPYRNSRISLLQYDDGEKRYILHPINLKVGEKVVSGKNVPLENGNCMPLKNIPLGTFVHNVELIPNKGGQIVRAAGTYSKILAKEGNYVSIRLPSREIRLINKDCFATLGEISNKEFSLIRSGKAGRTRWLGKRPTVRGSAMNACDHPHGGGEGKSSIGRSNPCTPWGKPALGVKTRKIKNSSTKYIIHNKK